MVGRLKEILMSSEGIVRLMNSEEIEGCLKS